MSARCILNDQGGHRGPPLRGNELTGANGVHAPKMHRVASVVIGVAIAFCAATLFIWQRSFRVCDFLEIRFNDWSTISVKSCRGSLILGEGTIQGFSPTHTSLRYLHELPDRPFGVVQWRFLGFSLLKFSGSGNNGGLRFYVRQTYFAMPDYFPLVLFSTVPAWRVIRPRVAGHVRRWRKLRGECVKCEYCLTGISSGRCPECGTPIESVTR